MLLLKRYSMVTGLLLLCLRVCNSQSAAIHHLNLKLNRLNRITSGLQKDVDDIWNALSSPLAVNNSSSRNQSLSNGADQRCSNPEEVLKRVNETTSNVEELKTEVAELIVYAKNGLKKEKALSRDAIEKLKIRQTEFETKVSSQQANFETKIINEMAEMKTWLQTFERTQKQTLEDMFERFRAKTQEDNRILLEQIHNQTGSSESQVEENKQAIQTFNGKLETVGQNFSAFVKEVTHEVALVKNEVGELQQALSCTDGWIEFESNCYYFSSEQMTWNEAMDFCKARHSSIIEIDDTKEVEFLVQHCQSLNVVWVGGTDIQKEGIFVWEMSKKVIPQDYFYPGEPNNAHGNEHCAELYCRSARVNKLNDGNCAVKEHFVCKKATFIMKLVQRILVR